MAFPSGSLGQVSQVTSPFGNLAVWQPRRFTIRGGLLAASPGPPGPAAPGGFVISVCQIVRLCSYQIPIRSGCASEMALPTSIYVSMVCRWRPPVWQSAQDTIIFFLGPARPRQPSQLSPASQAAFFNITFNFFLEPARPVMDFARNACTGGGALQLETPVPHMCRKAANLG